MWKQGKLPIGLPCTMTMPCCDIIMAFTCLGQFCQYWEYDFKPIIVLRVQKGISYFIVQAIVGFKGHLDEELVIATAKHTKCFWQWSCAYEKIRRQIPTACTIDSSSGRQKRRINPSSESSYSISDSSDLESYSGISYTEEKSDWKSIDVLERDHQGPSAEKPEVEAWFGNGKNKNGIYTGLLQWSSNKTCIATTWKKPNKKCFIELSGNIVFLSCTKFNCLTMTIFTLDLALTTVV